VALILPPAVAKWQFVEEKARAVLDAFGFGEARTPLLLPDGRLRPPGAEGLVRAYLQQGTAAPLRWYELGPVFRGSEQLAQIRGVSFGSGGAEGQAEVIGMVAGLVAEAGVPGARVLLAPAENDGGAVERVDALLKAMGYPRQARVNPVATFAFAIEAGGATLAYGARADGLLAELGGAGPAVAFSVDLPALVAAVPDPADSFVVPPAAVLVGEGSRAREWALVTAHHLRMAGVRVELGGGEAARLRVVARDQELERGEVTLEDGETGQREAVRVDNLESTIRARLD
jgi:histidyl-tRNA synthetase